MTLALRLDPGQALGVPSRWRHFDLRPGSKNGLSLNRQEDFKKANFENLITAVAGLLVLISSQFRDRDFSAGAAVMGVKGFDYHPMEAATGDLFRIKYPDDWCEEEIYDFDWLVLQNQTDRFEKINFDAIPC